MALLEIAAMTVDQIAAEIEELDFTFNEEMYLIPQHTTPTKQGKFMGCAVGFLLVKHDLAEDYLDWGRIKTAYTLLEEVGFDPDELLSFENGFMGYNPPHDDAHMPSYNLGAALRERYVPEPEYDDDEDEEIDYSYENDVEGE